MPKIKRIPLKPLNTNCYLVYSETTKKGILIDPGSEARKILEIIESLNLEILGIIATHGHFDHIGAVKKIKEIKGAPFYIHRDEILILEKQSIPDWIKIYIKEPFEWENPQHPDYFLEEGFSFEIDDEELIVWHTPGHSPGSISIVGNGFIFTGDLIFRLSIGRTDLEGGNEINMMNSIRRILTLKDETLIYPGHGPESTIIFEKNYNPYLRWIFRDGDYNS